MGSRPVPNPRRGILRAVLTVLGLSVLLLVAIFVVSSLTAPKANAPVTPPTPGPITPVTAPTPRPTVGATSKPAPSPTNKKKVLGDRLVRQPTTYVMEEAPSSSLVRNGSALARGLSAAHRGSPRVWFSHPSDNGTRALMHVVVNTRTSSVVGVADPLVRPVWSKDGRSLMYALVSANTPSSGARWMLREYDSLKGQNRTITSTRAVSVIPLGWIQGNPLFLKSNLVDTSVYAVVDGRTKYLGVLAPQIITSARLSPRDPVVAFAAPTNCYNCTLEFFDLRRDVTWSGPTGFTSESDFAWTSDGRSIVLTLPGKQLKVSDVPGSTPASSYAAGVAHA